MRLVRLFRHPGRTAFGANPQGLVFKARLDGALSNRVWWEMSLLMARGLEPDDL